MKIGVPKELKNNENRVALTPAGVMTLQEAGHDLFVETQAGEGSGFTDDQYREAGATVVDSANETWKQEMVMKVKEPLPEEYDYFYEGLILFTYLHLAAEPELTQALIDHKVTSIAYETVESDQGTLPLLTPMSEVAGRMASQIGAQFLEKTRGGKGVLLSGIPGVERSKVTVVGGGVVGTNAAKIAVGLGADVTIVDLSPNRLRELDDLFGNQINTVMSNPLNIEEQVRQSDLLIGAVLIPGAKAPKLVTEDMVKQMTDGSVIVDVAVDQGGIVETVDHITTHDNPTYDRHGVQHYAVANMPGAVPRTSTIGLTNVTVPYAIQLANKGYQEAVQDNPQLAKGVNTLKGYVTYKAVADAHGMDFYDLTSLI
ncbi:alanine dehydrogenase [Alkalibacillus almallahensis]|uniref:alanine dehydrogenase n=1 Tax=Alkalibacillus almallahensis TaxID=1379154 RepID=UPI00142084C7|nr:alanine dehydrogenase [Alkalibacillus almallahensis]NIK11067.1 alanine dehydrogenase [Alkalibacillus almallahensis]